MSEIAIAHKDYDVRGGGEVLAEELANTFDCPMVVGRRNGEVDERHDDVREIDLTRWQRFAINRGGMARSIAYWIAWQNASQLTDYETVILSGNEPLWYVPPQDQTVVAYTHSTPRWQYDLFHEHNHGAVDTMMKTAQRVLYAPNTRYPDKWVANSDVVARRMERYFDISRDEITVVYPPVKTRSYSATHDVTQDYYLYLGRLAGHKHVEDAVKAADACGVNLKVAGDGPEKSRLKSMAGKNVDILGRVSENRKRRLYAGAKALVYPCANEDFGMVPIEAMASGTPVIGVREGFTQHQIINGENGVLYDRGELTAAIRAFETAAVAWDGSDIERWAGEHFSVQRFRDEMRAVVREAKDREPVAPEWQREVTHASQ